METRCISEDTDARGVTYQCDLPAVHAGSHYNADGLHGWSRRHDITVTRRNGQHSLLIDGKRLLRGVRSVEVVNDVRELPIVRIELIAASVETHLELTPLTNAEESED